MTAKNNEAQITAPTVLGLHSNAAIEALHSADLAQQRKAFATLQARFATAGWEFTSVAGAGCTGPFLASRWGMARELDNMDQAGAFATAVGVHA